MADRQSGDTGDVVRHKPGMIGHHTKITELEAVRGIAALIVLLHHTLLAFAPRLEGLFFPTERFGLFGTPAYALVNGAAAVAVFFVLSGFVLTYRILASGDSSGLGLALLKRWPRLAAPVVIVSVVSGLLVWGGLYGNASAAEVSKSPWLGGWFASSPYKGLPPIAAAQEGLIGTFLRGQSYFNGNLWTMSYELFGSFLAFGIALVCVELNRPKISLALTALLYVLLLSWSPIFSMFVAGVGMAQVFTLYQGRFPTVRLQWIVLAAIAAFLMFGFRGTVDGGRAIGFYVGLRSLPRISPVELQTLIHTLAALLIMWLVMSVPTCRSALGGRFGAWAGRMSFPIYLTHLVVICSIGSHGFIWLTARLPHAPAVVLAVALTIVATIVCSYPLAIFDRWWVYWVNTTVASLRQRRPQRGQNEVLALAPPARLELRSESAA
jgi:peptidoglycan/LPS O-acetylase OafA/YrhL